MARIDRKDDLRPQEDEAAQDGKGCLHSRIDRRSGLLLLGFLDLFHVLGGIFLEILEAGLAAKLHFLAVVDKNMRVPHVTPESLVGHHASLERIRFGLLFGLFIIGGECRKGSGKKGGEDEAGSECLECFHRLIVSGHNHYTLVEAKPLKNN